MPALLGKHTSEPRSSYTESAYVTTGGDGSGPTPYRHSRR